LNEFQFETEEGIGGGVGKGHAIPDNRVSPGLQDFSDSAGVMGLAGGAGADNAHPIVDPESWLTSERLFHCEKIELQIEFQAYGPPGFLVKNAFLMAF
jgi:hypothetical protein